MNELRMVSESRCFGGLQRTYEHDSASCACPMRFAVFLPEHADGVPALYWLSGLTCTEENFVVKAGAQRPAAELGIALIVPDTSPRGVDIPGQDDRIDVGSGAGFYVNATRAPWAAHYRMYDYVATELVEAVNAHLPVDPGRKSISGHSMAVTARCWWAPGSRTNTGRSRPFHRSARPAVRNGADTRWRST